jgi:hypothetical protein
MNPNLKSLYVAFAAVAVLGFTLSDAGAERFP